MNHTNVVDVKAWIDTRPLALSMERAAALFHHHYAGWV